MAEEAVHWTVLDPVGSISGRWRFADEARRQVHPRGRHNPKNDSYTLVAHTDLKRITGLRLEVLPMKVF